jgi:hypothetical protein
VKAIEYETGAADYVAFNEWHAMTSPSARRHTRLSRLRTAVLVCLTLVVVIDVAHRDIVGGSITGVAAGLICWFCLPWYWRHQLAKASRRYLGGPPAKPPSIQHCLTIERGGLREHTDTSDTFVEWAGIKLIEESGDHAFIYIGSVEAFVLSKRELRDEVEDFLQEVRRHVTDSGRLAAPKSDDHE